MQITTSRRRRDLRAALTAVVVVSTTTSTCRYVVHASTITPTTTSATTSKLSSVDDHDDLSSSFASIHDSWPSYGGASVVATEPEDDEDEQTQQRRTNPNESWRSNEEWWKDPLAMFEDEEDDEDNEQVDQTLFAQQDEDVKEEAISDLPQEEPVVQDLVLGVVPTVTDSLAISKEQNDDDKKEEPPVAVRKPVAEATPKPQSAEKTAIAVAEAEEAKNDEPAFSATTSPVPTVHEKPLSVSTAASLVSTGGGAVALAALGPRLRALLTVNPVLVKWVAIAAVGKAFVGLGNSVLKTVTENRQDASTGRRSSENEESFVKKQDKESLDGKDVDQDIIDPVEQTLLEHLEEEQEEEDEELSEELEEGALETDKNLVKHLESPAQSTPGKSITDPTKTRGGGWKEACLAFLPSSGRPSRKQLLEQLQELQETFESSSRDKAVLEKDYEVSNYKLKEAEQELNALKQTNRYLQAQLRDQEEMLERVVSTERRKAREELVRMKDAMVQVVDKERDAMREEFLKQAAELQSLWKQKASKQSRGRTT